MDLHSRVSMPLQLLPRLPDSPRWNKDSSRGSIRRCLRNSGWFVSLPSKESKKKQQQKTRVVDELCFIEDDTCVEKSGDEGNKSTHLVTRPQMSEEGQADPGSGPWRGA